MPRKDLDLPPEVKAAHEKACHKKQKTYIDPLTGEEQHTEWYVIDRGFCCNQGCRHCAYWDQPQIRITYKDSQS